MAQYVYSSSSGDYTFRSLPSSPKFEEAKGLVRKFESKPILNEEDVGEASKLIKEFASSTNFFFAIEGLSYLIAIDNQNINEAIIETLHSFISFDHLPENMQKEQFQALIDLERQVSLKIDYYIRQDRPQHEMLLLFHFYQNLLDCIWLLPAVMEDDSDYISNIEQNKIPILGRATQWIGLIEKVADRDDLRDVIHSIQTSLRRSVASHSKEIFEKIKKLKPQVKKIIFFSALVGDICQKVQDFKRAAYYYQKSLELINAQKKKSAQNPLLGLEGGIHVNLGECCHDLNNFHMAIENYEIATKIYKEIKNPQKELSVLKAIGLSYFSLGNYQEAIQAHEKALVLAQKLGEIQSGVIYYNLGDVYQFLKNYQEAVAYYQKGLSIAIQFNIRPEISKGYNKLGIVYQSLADHRKAVKYHEKYLENAQEEDSILRVQSNLIDTYLMLGQIEKAVDIAERMADMYYMNFGDIASAIDTLVGLRIRVPSHEYPELNAKLVKAITRIHEEEGQITEALSFLEQVKQEKEVSASFKEMVEKEIRKYFNQSYLVENDCIRIKRKLFDQAEEILKEALNHLDGCVYLKINPFYFGSILFCYREKQSNKVVIFMHYKDFEKQDQEEIQKLKKIEDIQYDPSYRKIEVRFDLS